MSHRVLVGLVVAGSLLVALRAGLPYGIEAWVNHVLDRTEGYQGRVEDVDLALVRGAYTIEGAALEDTGGDVPVPIFSAPRMELSVRWSALLRGGLVGEIVLERPVVNLVAAPTAEEQQTGTRPHWTERVEELFPVEISRFEVRDGTLHFRDFHAEPEVDARVTELRILARNLTNVRERSRERPATAEASGVAFGSGRLRVRGRIDPFASKPDFTFAGSAEGIELTKLDDFLRAYLGVDAQRGRLDAYSELRAQGGDFDGYVKLLVDDLDVLHIQREGHEQGPLDTVWEAVAGATAELLEAQGPDRQGVRVPVEGRFEQPRLGIFAAVESVLRHAFVQAIQPGFSGLVRGGDVPEATSSERPPGRSIAEGEEGPP